jgi:heme-degrading monooxygenase HmoA
MFITINRYAGAGGLAAEAAPSGQQGLVPLLQAQPGFLGYAALRSEQGDIVSVALWETADAAANSREKIREWVLANVAGLNEPDERFQGEVAVHAMAEPQSGQLGQPLYCLIRKAENLPDAEVSRPVVENMLAACQKVPGFRGGYWSKSVDDPTRGASVLLYDSREYAQAAHEVTSAIAQQGHPQVTVRVVASGETVVLAMA